MTENLQCKIESNQLSRTALRRFLGARFVRLFFPQRLLLKSARQPQIWSQKRLSEAIQAHWHEPLFLRSDHTQKHNSLTKSSSCFSARSTSSPIQFNDWPAKNSNRKANGKWWRIENSHCGRWAVSTTPSDTFFFASLFRRRISESVNPSDSYPETPTSSTPTTTSTPSSSSFTSASVPASVSHTPPTSVGPSGHPTGLSSPPSPATFSSGTAKGERETVAWTADLLSAWDEFLKENDTFYGHTSEFSSKNVANKLLHSGYIISFLNFINIFFNMTDSSASNYVILIFSRTHWGKKLKFSSFLNFFSWYFYKFSTSVIAPNTRLDKLKCYGGNFKASRAWRRMPTDFCLHHHFFK